MEFILGVVITVTLSIALLFAGQRLKIPSVVSFLLLGMLVGPFGLSVIQNQEAIDIFGEVGILLLLFTIGLEFSFDKLMSSWRMVIIGGLMQVCTTIVAITAITDLLGFPFREAVFFGFLVSLSSTAIVMKVLQERGEVDTLPGRTMLGILIFQDLAIIPMILITPLLMGSGGPTYNLLPMQVAKVVVILAVLLISAIWLVPAFLYRVAKEQNRELFLFTIGGICFAVAWLTNAAGLSLSLGAFAAGLIIGESEYSIDALSDIIPFRDIFASVFFLSIGMLLDTRVVLAYFPIVVTVIITIIGVKVLTGSFSSAVLGLPARVCIFTGLSLCQIGEFSFVLAKTGLQTGLIPPVTYQVFLAGAIVTMAITPFSMKAAPGMMTFLYRLLPWDGLREETEAAGGSGNAEGHMIIVGYGLTGQSVARAAEIAGIPYTIIELDPDIVRREKSVHGHRVIYGDATHEEILRHAGVKSAVAIVIVVSEQAAIPRIIRNARRLSPSIYIISRTRSMKEITPLLLTGADEVIPEEFEASLRIFSRVLAKYNFPETEITHLVNRIRGHTYRIFTRESFQEQSVLSVTKKIEDHRIHTLNVEPGSRAVGKTLAELGLGTEFQITEMTVRREGRIVMDPFPRIRLEEGDTVIIYGSEQEVAKVRPLLSGTR